MSYNFGGVSGGRSYDDERGSNEPTNVGVTPITVVYDSTFMNKCKENTAGTVYPVTDSGDSHSVRNNQIAFQLLSSRSTGQANVLVSVGNIPHDAIPGVNLGMVERLTREVMGDDEVGKVLADILNNAMGIVGIIQNITGPNTPMLTNTVFRGGKYRLPTKDRTIRPGDRVNASFLAPSTLQIGMESMKAAGFGDNFCGPVLTRASSQGYVEQRMKLVRQVLSNPTIPNMMVNQLQLAPSLSPLIATNVHLNSMLTSVAVGLGLLLEARVISIFNSIGTPTNADLVRDALPGSVDANRFRLVEGNVSSRSNLPSMTGISSAKIAALLCCDAAGNDVIDEQGRVLAAPETHLVPNDASTFTTMLMMIFGIVPYRSLKTTNPLIEHLRLKLDTSPDAKELAIALTTALSRTIAGFPDSSRTYEVYQPYAYVEGSTLRNAFVRSAIGMPSQPDATTYEGYALAKAQQAQHALFSCEQYFNDFMSRNYFGVAYEGVNLEGQCGVVAAP